MMAMAMWLMVWCVMSIPVALFVGQAIALATPIDQTDSMTMEVE